MFKIQLDKKQNDANFLIKYQNFYQNLISGIQNKANNGCYANK
jgi:hypothetical protein